MYPLTNSKSLSRFVMPASSTGERDFARASIRLNDPDEKVEVLDTGMDFDQSALGRIVLWQIVDRADGRFYQSIFHAEPDEIRVWFRSVPTTLLETALAENSLSESGTCEVLLERSYAERSAACPDRSQSLYAATPQWARENTHYRMAWRQQLPQAGKALRLIISLTQHDEGWRAVPAIVPRDVFECDVKVLEAGVDTTGELMERPVAWRIGERD